MLEIGNIVNTPRGMATIEGLNMATGHVGIDLPQAYLVAFDQSWSDYMLHSEVQALVDAENEDDDSDQEQCPDCLSTDLTLLPATCVHPQERYCNECGSGIPF